VTAARATALERLWAYADLASTVLIILGAIAAVFVGAVGAVLMLAGLGLSLSTHLIVGVTNYRRVMAREWPKVRPLDDGDEW
jgi:hypothetical protein